MGIITWIVLGGFAGWIASMVMKNNASQGVIGNIVVGVVGALIGGFIFNLFGGLGLTGFNFYSLFVAVIGAIILLAIVRAFR